MALYLLILIIISFSFAGNNQLVFIESPWATPCLVLNGYMYNCHSRKSNKQYWRCHNYSKKVHELRCRSRCVLENGRLKSITGGLHNHPPHSEKIEKIVQRNKLAAVSTSRKIGRNISEFSQQPKEEYIEEPLTGGSALQLTEHDLMNASLMLIHE